MEMAAPWAEPALLTADQLLALPEDGYRYELVEGRLVRMSPTGFEHGAIVLAMLREIDRFVQEHALGTVSPAETGFLISSPSQPDVVLAPDLAFIEAVRAPTPTSPEWKKFPRLIPDLVVEVASPSQGRSEMAAKVRVWLEAGVRIAWLVLPDDRMVEVWRSGAPAQALPIGGELQGEDVLPGFTIPVGRLFP